MNVVTAVGFAVGLMALTGPAGAGRCRLSNGVVVGQERLNPVWDEKAVWSAEDGWGVEPVPHAEYADGTEAEVKAGYPVLYVAGRPRSELTRRVVTGKIAVALADGADGPQVAVDHELIDEGEFPAAAPIHLFRAPHPAAVLAVVDALRSDSRVVDAEVELARPVVPRGLPNDPLLSEQWNVKNGLAGGPTPPVDLNLESVWGDFGGVGWRGLGIRIGIIDDGIDYAHPDLVGRIDTAADFNWNDGPATVGAARLPRDSHGTAVAGLAAATADNGIGLAGVAPEATVVSLRLTADLHSDSAEAQCFSYLANDGDGFNPNPLIHIKNGSWGPEDGIFALAGPSMPARQALINATSTGRVNRGTIFVWAVGNGGAVGEDANADGYANDIHVIAVGAVNAAGQALAYSEAGACVAVCAPSAAEGQAPLVTTDRLGLAGFNPPAAGGPADLSDPDYTRLFGGTSAAAPQVAGVCALMLQANPTLGWRDVKEILMRSARKVSPMSTAWITNGAGLSFHPFYGAGLVDAAAAVGMATTWTNLGAMRPAAAANTQSGTIPDDRPAGLIRAFDFSQHGRVEHATLKVKLTHPYRGDLKILLRSPAGTTSVLAPSFYLDDTLPNYTDWTFSTVQMWGEDLAGRWTVQIIDVYDGGEGSFVRADLVVFGGDADLEPVFTSAERVRCAQGEPFSFVVAASNGPNTYSAETPLPAGVRLNPSTGVLGGTCLAPGPHSIILRATNGRGFATQSFIIDVLTPYEAWTIAQGLTAADAEPVDDPDDDEVCNLLEFGSGRSAVVSDGRGLGRVEVTGDGRSVFIFDRWPARRQVGWVVERSTDCDEWEPVAQSFHGEATESLETRYEVTESPQADGSIQVRVADARSPEPQAWFRLKARFEP